MDRNLAHLLEDHRSLQERWRTQKTNRRLRKRIALLNRQIEEYSQSLTCQQWNEVCKSLDARMRKGLKWDLLKHLLGDKPTKSEQRLTLDRLLHKARGQQLTDAQILDATAARYLCTEPS
ncbi:hypothetical protein HPB50_010965 [Hyalomma asiaticum]|uniref:Uncharacterized protein n=1 Tax=Hyalomma asiaticum TaxID=266040 RepID=A0ACB7S698_HYAAI|nr:hypothetical protein HPB50_010965 [Hyalomma asiaticum]